MKRFQELTNPKEHNYFWKSGIFCEKFWSYDILLWIHLWVGHAVPLCLLLQVQWDVIWLSVFEFQGRNQVSQREGLSTLACMCVAEHTCPHTGTLPCATLWYCLVPWAPWWGKSNFSSSTLVCSRSACLGGSLPVSNPSKPDSLCLLNACACRPWKPVQQFLSNLILLPKDKIIQGFEEAWATPQCNDPVGEAWKISLWESTCSCKTRVKILGIQNY